MRDMVTGCPAERTLQVVGGRWKVFILHHLFSGTTRFAELQRQINALTTSNVTPKMLTQELRQMEADGLVHREVYAQVPPKVEYSLTPLGMSLRPVVDAMIDWGRRHEREMEGVIRPCEEGMLVYGSSHRRQEEAEGKHEAHRDAHAP